MIPDNIGKFERKYYVWTVINQSQDSCPQLFQTTKTTKGIMEDAHANTEATNYKFKELKVYASTEWLADNKKKYRQVFDRYEITYVYAELSFHNKKFDVEDWDIEVELRCYYLRKGRKEICSLPFQRKVSKYDNVVFIREGWGNKKEGAFWKKGTYYWEAWIEGERVGTKYFYIEDAEKEPVKGKNPYVEVQSLRLYEGPYDDLSEDDRIYYKKFSSEESRYIYVEILLRNLNQANNWQCELFTKFYNDARELKGQVVRLQRVEKQDEEIKITAGWGSNVKGSWRKDRYTAELIFMDHLLAVIPFDVEDEFEEGISGVLLPNRQAPVILSPEEATFESFEEVMNKLDALIGLQEIKEKVKDHARYIQFLQLRKELGFPEKEQINVHAVFIGNPGTGKTTVAKMMGKLYRQMGLLTKGHVHEVDRVDLVGEYIGQTAPKVKEAIEKARGGVLFIDEAYALARSNDDSKDFGREVIEILVKEMSNGKGDIVVIAAGYPNEMQHFLDSNPGLKSRFNLSYEFADYLPQELSRIATFASNEKSVVLTPEAKKKLDEIIVDAFRNRDRTFGNARYVYELIEKAKINLGLRVMASDNPRQLSRTKLETIELEDVIHLGRKISKELPEIPIDEHLLKVTLEELDNLIGMQKVKEQVHELVRLVRYYSETGKNILNSFFLHTVFVGNPGTGKTTVARIIASLYKALGILERGHMVETDRQGLVAGYVGQTAIKTTEKIDEALGGVLFIDEAYALSMTTGTQGDFGDEAIQTLLKRMEDQRGQFFVFVSGYPDNMEAFLKANPGLSSRFDKILKFDDYQPQELLAIAEQMLDQEGLVLEPDAREHLRQYLSFLFEYRDKYFGNARTVRNVVSDIIKNQNLRLAAIPPSERQMISSTLISIEDVLSLKMDKSGFIFNKKSIGFKQIDK